MNLDDLKGWRRMLVTLGVIWVSAFLTQLLASWVGAWPDATILQEAARAGLVAVMGAVVKFIAPFLKDYGFGAEKLL